LSAAILRIEDECIERILVEMSKEKRPSARLIHRWEDNIKINLERTRMEWYELHSLASG
jgi:hypothetical protein